MSFLFLLLVLVPCFNAWTQHHSCSSHFDVDGLEILNCSYAKFQKIASHAVYAAPRNVWMPSLFTAQIKELHLRGNELKALNSSSFLTLRYPETLEKLDLSNNKIVSISSNAFQGLRNLKHLDLSGNLLYTLNRTTFTGLANLETLILDDNFFSVFPEKTFSALQQLRTVSIRSNQFTCDCQLTDFFKSLQRERRPSVQISNETKCVFPITLRGIPVSQINGKIVRRSCGKGDFNPDVFTIEPSAARSLIVYPGDERRLTCKISNIPNTTLEWLRNGAPIKESPHHSRLQIQTKVESKLKKITLTIKAVSWDDSGDWTCYAEHKESSLRMTVRLMPIAANTEKCVQEWTADEKGEIVWAEARHLKTVASPCPGGPEGAHAKRQCSQGRWSAVENSECAYASAMTKKLYEIYSNGNKKTFVQDFLNTTVTYATVSLSAYDTRLASWLIGNATDTGGVLLTTAVAEVLRSPHAATEVDGHTLRNILQNALINEVPLQTEQMAVCQHMFLPQSMDQLSISPNQDHTSALGFLAARVGKRYVCVRQNSVDLLSANGMTSMRVPSHTIETLPPVTVIRSYWFANQRLFQPSNAELGQWVAHGEVQGVALKKVNLKLYRVDQPKNIQSSVQLVHPTPLQPAIYFSFPIKYSADNIRFGTWSEKNGWIPVDETLCYSSIVGPRSVLISCSSRFVTKLSENITYVSILENASIYQMIKSHKAAIHLPWWTYISSGFLASSVLIVILINIGYIRRSISGSRKMLHSMLNVCLTIFALSVTFTIGIDKVYNQHVCRVTSVSLHYFILTVVFWILIAIRQVHRNVTSAKALLRSSVDDNRKRETSHEALAGFYFFAYGVPLIVVSFSVAVHTEAYNGTVQYCFPSSSRHFVILEAGLIAPYAFVSTLCLALIVLTWYESRKKHSKSPSPMPLPARRTHQNSVVTTKGDESSVPLVTPVNYEDSVSAATPNLDFHSSASFQLLCLMSLLCLYTICVATACLFITQQFSSISPILPLWTSALHSVCAVLLALSLFMMHIVKRFRMLWSKLARLDGFTSHPHSSIYSKPFPCTREKSTDLYSTQRGETVVREYDEYYGSHVLGSMNSDGSRSQVALSPAAMASMHNTARKFYKRQRQMATLNNSYATGDAQEGIVIPEETRSYESALDTANSQEEMKEYYKVEVDHSGRRIALLDSSEN
ncbi:hypothetical protein QR680_002139 [Steinernema hermaphroditum]|uniref:Ig-like domain-containing protein n=1 Tax=Steinernema hermaphroditum TaxID=289476 RepID=A0AA39LHN8_9BILA|nr:hypothetical protein QR680_002139 [Steinernema hermaphroditum]